MIQINFSSSSLWCVSRSFLHSIRKIVWWLDEKSGKNIRRRDFPFFFPRGGLICALCAARGPAPPASYSLRRSLVYWLVVSLRSLPLVLLPSLSFNLFFFYCIYIYIFISSFLCSFDSSALCSASLQWRPSRREIASPALSSLEIVRERTQQSLGSRFKNYIIFTLVSRWEMIVLWFPIDFILDEEERQVFLF